MNRIVFHVEAEFELSEAVGYYEHISSGLGLRLEEETRHALASIQEMPGRYPPQNNGTRTCLLRRFPFAVYFLEFQQQIWIIAFAHTSRKPYYWRERLK